MSATPLLSALPVTRPRAVIHVDDPSLIQMVTFRLNDAFPDWAEPRHVVQDQDHMASKLWFRPYDRLLDEGHGECLLAQPAVAALVRDALLFGARERYELFEWVIMPNHVHVLLQTRPGWLLSRIMRDFKGYTARQINLRLRRTGPVWRKEYYDRYMRNDRHFAAARQYIGMNPVRAKLAEAPQLYRWSSAGAGDRMSPVPAT